MSVAEVVAGAETGREAGAGAAAAEGGATAAAAAVGAAAAGAAAASASADSPSARRASEAPSAAAGVAMRINPVIQMPRPSHNPKKRETGGGRKGDRRKTEVSKWRKNGKKIQTWCVVRDY